MPLIFLEFIEVFGKYWVPVVVAVNWRTWTVVLGADVFVFIITQDV